MARRGRRYDDGAKLNLKKVFGVIFIFILIIACIVGTVKLLNNDSKSMTGKIENVYYYTIYDNGKWGVVNSYGEIVVKATYDEMIVIPDEAQDIFICTYDADYSNGTYKTKIINSKEKEIIKNYDKIEAIANYDEEQNIWYEDNVLKVQSNGKYGLVNYSGKSLLNTEYDSIKAIYGIQNSLLIEKSGKYGVCDNLGNIIIEPNYKKIEKIGNDYKNGYIVVNEENKYGIIGFDKQTILDTKYEDIKGTKGENSYAVKQNGKYVIINKNGEKVVNKEFQDILAIEKDCIIVSTSGTKYGVVDLNGETKISMDYDELEYINNNNFIAKKDGKYGVVSISNQVVLQVQSTGMVYVKSGNFIIADYNENGNIISKIYNADHEEKMSGVIKEVNTTKGYIRIYTNNEYKYYNFKFEEKSASQILNTNNLFVSKKDGKYGFVDATRKCSYRLSI